MTTTTTTTKRVLKKLTVLRVDLAKQATGFELEGKFIGFSDAAPYTKTDVDTGVSVEIALTNAVFENSEMGRFAVIADKGLKASFNDAMVAPGMNIVVRKLDMLLLKSGNKMNQYEIFAVE